jgi:dipeptidyl-peptidase 4
MRRIALLFMAASFLSAARADDDLRTVAEKSDFKATSKHADVMDLCKKIEAASKGVVKLTTMGKSTEGRDIPLLIVADPPVSTPEEARKSGKLVAFIIGNIHAGEVDGKEGLLMLVREMATTPHHPLLKDLILLAAPIYNADGNEKFSKTNRPGQVGPDEMGVRANGQGLDLNRDFVKLEAPETRAFVDVLNAWDPHLFIDLHTTNGSHHRYVLTYQGPKNPAGDPDVLAYCRDVLMPGAGKLLEAKTGFKSFFYGNFDKDHTLWTTYGATPRFGTTYVGLRGRMGILSETYSYATYKERVIASEEFARALLTYASAHKDEIRKMLSIAKWKGSIDEAPIRSEPRVSKEKVAVLGYVEEVRNGRSVATNVPKDYVVGFEQEFVPILTVKAPTAYLVPAKYDKAIAVLKRHGLNVEILDKPREFEVEPEVIEAIDRAPRPFEGHRTIDLKTAPTKATKRTMPAGTAVVSVWGTQSALVVYLLEARSDDGLATWNFFDEGLEVGKEFPVLRVPVPAIPK